MVESVILIVVVLSALVDKSFQDGGYAEKRPQFFPIYPQKQAVYYQAGFQHTKDGIQAAYRNDQRQEYVNNVAYKHRTGLGTAPWYGVPGTSYNFDKSKSSGPTYQTDPSHPNGYGYEAPLAQYHSQPHTPHHHGGYKSSKQVASQCNSAAAYGKAGGQLRKSASATDAVTSHGYHQHGLGPVYRPEYVSGSYESVGYGLLY